MADNEKLVAVFSFVAGVAIGTNWGKIKKNLAPLLSLLSDEASNSFEKASKLAAEQKEDLDDMIAASRIAVAKKNMEGEETSYDTVNSGAVAGIIRRKKAAKNVS